MNNVEAWTYEEGLRFACARDLLTAMIGARSAMIAEEMQKTDPDLEVITKFRDERLAFTKRRDSFHVGDREEIEVIFEDFSEIVRNEYSKNNRALPTSHDA